LSEHTPVTPDDEFMNRTLTVNYWQLMRMLSLAWDSGYTVAGDEWCNCASGMDYDPKLNMDTEHRKDDDVCYCMGVLSGQLTEEPVPPLK
jgi:hypothetical protein